MPEQSPEIMDIMENIRRYVAVNPNCAFVFQFIAFEPDHENSCEDCGGECQKVAMEKSVSGAFGHLEELRVMLNVARNEIEDSVEEDGFVNI